LFIRLVFSLFVFSFFPASSLHAKDGWDLIRESDHRTARMAFAETLQLDSLDVEALKGKIFLSDIEGDHIGYAKYVNTLIRNHNDVELYMLFSDMVVESRPGELAEKFGYGSRVSVTNDLVEAYEYLQRGDITHSREQFRLLVPDFKWSVIGPFRNVEGSGYDITYEVESEKFNPAAEYSEGARVPLKWVDAEKSYPDGGIHFGLSLPDHYESVYYANSFFTMEESKEIQLRLTRQAPVKIWLDDVLIYTTEDRVEMDVDNDIISLNIPAGTHRLLIKHAPSVHGRYGSSQASFWSVQDFISEADEYGGSREYAYSYDHEYSASVSFPDLIVRVTDKDGAPVAVSSAFRGNYSSHTYDNVTVINKPLVNAFITRVNVAGGDLFNWYALYLAYAQTGLTDDGEEFFVQRFQGKKTNALQKYLLARLYSDNGKSELAYEAVNDIDADKAPIFSLLLHKLAENDRNLDPEKYEDALNELRLLTPSNIIVINEQLDYYDVRGRDTTKSQYALEMMRTYPQYRGEFSEYLTDEEQEAYEKETDKLYREEGKAKRKEKSDYKQPEYTNEYSPAWAKASRFSYGNSKKTDKASEAFDKVIGLAPYNSQLYFAKAEYMEEQEAYGLAIEEYRKLLKIAPYNASVYEHIGDMYEEQDMDDSALFYYKQAKHYGRLNARHNYNYGSSLEEKMEKIEGPQVYKKHFETKTFNDILKDTSWQNKYEGEEALVLMFTRDLLLDEYGSPHIYQKLMVKILTEAGASQWTEYDFSFLGDIYSAKVIKTSGAEVRPEMRGGYAVFKNLKPGDIIQLEGSYDWYSSSEIEDEFWLISYLNF
ncbi:MAG: tetratricopeptide repeat protein, partial [Bacteroidota bacterium]|nr:tetratricopeptide repeat protein [Bacteroidota bacterium]